MTLWLVCLILVCVVGVLMALEVYRIQVQRYALMERLVKVEAEEKRLGIK